MRRIALICWATLSVALTGCPEYNRYEVKLKPAGKAIDREVLCWRERLSGGKQATLPFPPAALEEMATAYGHKPIEEQRLQYRFKGRFDGQMPLDIGGSGRYFTVDSPAGSITTYIERFRGDDDLVGQFQRLADATNRLTDLLVGWFESQMRDDASWPKVRKFLDGEFRRDIHNLSLYFWLARTNAAALERPEDPTANDEQMQDALYKVLARLGQYLLEHGYLDPTDALRVTRELVSAGPEDNAQHVKVLGSYAQRILIEKCGLEPTEGAKSLNFLVDADNVVHSFQSFVVQTATYEEVRRARQAKGLPTHDASDVLGDLFEDVVHFHLLDHADEIDVSLAIAEKPLATNGTWDEAAGRVIWRRSLAANDSLSTLCFATWGQPDGEFQDEHFGRVALRGEKLAQYVALYAVLDDEDRIAVDQLLERLKPGDDLIPVVHRYVAEEQEAHPKRAEIAEILRKALLRDSQSK